MILKMGKHGIQYDHHPSAFVTNLPRMQRDLDSGPVPAAAIRANAHEGERGNVGKYGTRDTEPGCQVATNCV